MTSPWAYKQMRSQPRLPFPGHKPQSPIFDETAISSPDLLLNYNESSQFTKEDLVRQLGNFAAKNPCEFEEYVVENVRLETICKWLAKKKSWLHSQGLAQKDEKLGSKSVGDVGYFRQTAEDGQRQNELTEIDPQINNDDCGLTKEIESGKYLRPLYSLCSQLRTITVSSGFSFYAAGGTGDSLHLYNPDLAQWKANPSPKHRCNITPSYPVGKKCTVASYVAHSKQPIIVEDLQMDERFPHGSATQDSSAVTVLCLPLLIPNGDLLGVVELYRTWHQSTYTPDTLHLAKNILNWVLLAIHKSETSSGLQQQSEMSQFLLEVSRTYLDDITDIDNIIQHIMRFAKALVSADRCSLFLLDKDAGELYSNLFDTGEEKDGEAVFSKRTEIRFPATKGIAGNVASTKSILNIPDAYADTRFNREVDKITGYTTKSILCIPIMGDDEVYGVVEMINKKGGGAFTMTDQDNFQMFAVFCALALRYSKIHSRLRRDQCSFDVLKEQYYYHSRYPQQDYDKLLERQSNGLMKELIPSDFDRFQFSVMPYDSELQVFFIEMVRDLVELPGGIITVPNEMISRFVLTVRSNYREMPYHNWHHVMTVTHTMYCILKRNVDLFDDVERFSLLVACVCHDLDHRSLSNQFLQKTEHPLASLYTTSTMEHHHLQTTLDILGREGNDIFVRLTANDKDKAFRVIRDAILATDLALYFGNRSHIERLLNRGEFDFDNSTHRTSAVGLMMTACDISSTAKDWKTTKSNVFDLYQEFWREGDRRKKLGIALIPMMDRLLEEDLPEGQVGFYSNVSVKCFETLARVLPTCEPLVTGAKMNLERWRKEEENVKAIKEERVRKLEKEKRREEELEQEGIGLTLRGGMWMVEQSRSPV